MRDTNNATSWRVISLIASLILAFRTFSVVHQQRRDEVQQHGSASIFLLEVLGGAGAVWGASEIVGLRTKYPLDCHEAPFNGVGDETNFFHPGFDSCSNTYLLWRVITCIILFLFFSRYVIMSKEGYNRQRQPLLGGSINGSTNTDSAVREIERLVSTFVLEVLGGCGAVWGASEIVGLRKGWSDEYFGQPSMQWWRFWVMPPTFLFCLCMWMHKNKRRSVCSSLSSVVVQRAGEECDTTLRSIRVTTSCNSTCCDAEEEEKEDKNDKVVVIIPQQ